MGGNLLIVSAGLAGAWRVMLGDERGMGLVDASRRGVWLSLWGVAIALAIATMGSARFHDLAVAAGRAEANDLGARVVADAWHGLLAHGAGLLVVLAFARREAARFAGFVAAMNWAAAVLASAFALPFLIFWTALARRGAEGALDGATALFLLAIIAIGAIARYRVIRIAFQMERSRAFAVAVIALIVEQMVVTGLAA